MRTITRFSKFFFMRKELRFSRFLLRFYNKLITDSLIYCASFSPLCLATPGIINLIRYKSAIVVEKLGKAGKEFLCFHDSLQLFSYFPAYRAIFSQGRVKVCMMQRCIFVTFVIVDTVPDFSHISMLSGDQCLENTTYILQRKLRCLLQESVVCVIPVKERKMYRQRVKNQVVLSFIHPSITGRCQ